MLGKPIVVSRALLFLKKVKICMIMVNIKDAVSLYMVL